MNTEERTKIKIYNDNAAKAIEKADELLELLKGGDK